MTKITFLAILILYALTGISQIYIISDLSSLSDQYTVIKSGRSGLVAPDIDGTPYMMDEFSEGEVIINDSICIEKVPLRYNIYNDKIEYKNEEGQILEIGNESTSYQFDFDDFSFHNLKYVLDGNTQTGILELLVDGNVKLYKQYRLEFAPAQKAIGFQEATPDRFVRKEDQYLISIGQELPYVFSNAKKLLPELQKVRPDINSVIKKQKIRIRSEKGLCTLIKYCNE
ncbi:hypothetical protein [Draconibacterium halophilum]|uniref:Uncharacterized protein n=1 Tax=Draconibacterium halophilum TaxID=2706887 RepID=A0A6C0RD78_9BACT|nr:hypothetical protein [Draconibacterium halophilum]QIA08089.1 hypothetical protein G0Q07_10310 [Draconibacterium halophilum]